MQLRFKTGENVRDEHETTSTDARPRTLVAVRHRASGSSSVYFGPFGSMSDLELWADRCGMSVGVLELVDPNSDESTWWNRT